MNKNENVRRIAGAMTVAGALLLSACGGGGNSSSSAPSLSAAQQNYESVTLASNGGAHYVRAALLFSTSSTGALSVNSSSAFFTQNSSLTQSPAVASPQMLTTGSSTLDPALPVPPLTGDRYLVNGAVAISAVPAQVQVNYSGQNVQETELAADGKTPVMTLLGTAYTAVPLSGLISSSPSELFSGSGLGAITNTINGTSLYNTQMNWQSGAAYLKATRQVVGDTVLADDCVAPNTTGTNVTPCSTTVSTLEAFFPFSSVVDNKTYNLSDGQIVTLAGTRAWVSNTALNTATPQYRVFYQANGQIDSATVIRDGTTLAITNTVSGTPQDFYIFLNGAAVESIKAALTF